MAKDQNVRLRSGWFSERDACYLATGKPVIAQSTGFENFLPTGEGLFAFRTMDDVLAAVDSVESDYEKACRAARAVAEEHLSTPRGSAAVPRGHRPVTRRFADLQRRRLRLQPWDQPRHRARPTSAGIVTSTTFIVNGSAAREAVGARRGSGRGSTSGST